MPAISGLTHCPWRAVRLATGYSRGEPFDELPLLRAGRAHAQYRIPVPAEAAHSHLPSATNRPMDINELPVCDMDDDPTGCCPRFDPANRAGQRIHFRGKRFVRARTRQARTAGSPGQCCVLLFSLLRHRRAGRIPETPWPPRAGGHDIRTNRILVRHRRALIPIPGTLPACVRPRRYRRSPRRGGRSTTPPASGTAARLRQPLRRRSRSARRYRARR